jgi:hypothetical protein
MAMAKPGNLTDPDRSDAPAAVRTHVGAPPCSGHDRCRWYDRQMRDVLVGRYIAEHRDEPAPIVAALLPLSDLDWESYGSMIRRRYKGNAVRDARKADTAGLTCRPFDPIEHIDDIVAINHSSPERCGRPMTDAYRRSVEQMRSDAAEAVEFQAPVCDRHYDRWWGIFDPAREDALRGYIRVRRNGNYALYAQILGHAEDLRLGIMYRLHLAVMEWLLARADEAVRDLAHLVYGGFDSGGEGLQLWKKKMCFAPAHLVLDDS